MLLRRQVARHCIYGVDLHNVAVDLAKVAMWIHTFVPGLPLTLFSHNLKCGNSLTGLKDLEEAKEILAKQGFTEQIFLKHIEEVMQEATVASKKLAGIRDETVAELAIARDIQEEATVKMKPARMLFDLIAVQHAGVEVEGLIIGRFDPEDIEKDWQQEEIQEVLKWLQPLHFQVAFPEVFTGERLGFDCILGNPPWEKVKIESDNWWKMHVPKIRGLSTLQRQKAIANLEQERPDLASLLKTDKEEVDRYKKVLKKKFDMGKGDPDLYKVFTWRFFQLTKQKGYLGVVLPWSAMQAKGSEEWRKTILREGEFVDVIILQNRDHWVFDDVAFNYLIALCSVRKSVGDMNIRFGNLYSSLEEYQGRSAIPPEEISVKEFLNLSPTASFPIIPTGTLSIFRKLKQADMAVTTRNKVQSVRDLETLNKDLFSNSNQEGYWPVYKGGSFNFWNPDTGDYYIFAEPAKVLEHQQKKRERQVKTRSAAFFGADENWWRNPDTLPCHFPRIAYRNIASPAAKRTCIVCLIPPKTFLVENAPYLFFPSGDKSLEAFYLGVMVSVPFDWYVRRVVVLHITVSIFGECPFPSPPEDDPIRGRVIEITGRLAAVDDRYEEWASEVGVPVASANSEPHKSELIAELDAAVALLYELTETDLRLIWQTFHPTLDHLPKLDKVLGYYRNLQG